MSEKTILLKLITHEKVLYEGNIDELYVQASDGRIGILPNHVPIISTLNIGVTKIVANGTARNVATMGGILQFAHNTATILTDNAEFDTDIDVARAREAKRRAEARLSAKDENIDSVRAQIALSKAIARINACELKY